jgi:hypothetical protein
MLTSFIAGSTETHETCSSVCIVAGKASKKGRTWMRFREEASRMTTESAEGYNCVVLKIG